MHTDSLLTSALRHLGHIEIVVTTLDDGHDLYDHHTNTLYVDRRCDVLTTIRGALVELVPVERELAVIDGGRTACGVVPRPRGAGRDPSLRVVRDVG